MNNFNNLGVTGWFIATLWLLLVLVIVVEVVSAQPVLPTPTQEVFPPTPAPLVIPNSIGPSQGGGGGQAVFEVPLDRYMNLIRFAAVEWCVAADYIEDGEQDNGWVGGCIERMLPGACAFYLEGATEDMIRSCFDIDTSSPAPIPITGLSIF